MSAHDLHALGRELYVGGVWRLASDEFSFEVMDPGTEAVLARVSDATVDDGVAAVDAAYKAGPAWAAKAPRERAELLRHVFELMIKNRDALARVITLENGKTLAESRAEVAYAAEFLRWYSEEAVRIQGEISVAPNGAHRIVVLSQPVGVSLFVTPWNFPAAMATRKIGPALAAGCTVVLKPAKETPLTALALAALFEEAGLPAGVVNVLPSTRSPALVRALLNDRRVRKLSFTGSTETGRILLAQAAANVVNCSMELGGNAPFIVFADADLDVAVASAMTAKLRNGGQSCTAANRFYVERAVATEFGERLAQAMREVKLGYGLDEGVQLGPLVNAEARARVAQLVEEALDHGARPLAGAKVPKGRGFFYEPTVLAGVKDELRVMREEVFGPVAPIATFDSEEEAIGLANGTDLGLVSFVHTRDIGRGLSVAERIEAGMVGLNRGLVSDPAAPFGGWKQSGIGREGAHAGLLEYLETKYVAAAW